MRFIACTVSRTIGQTDRTFMDLPTQSPKHIIPNHPFSFCLWQKISWRKKNVRDKSRCNLFDQLLVHVGQRIKWNFQSPIIPKIDTSYPQNFKNFLRKLPKYNFKNLDFCKSLKQHIVYASTFPRCVFWNLKTSDMKTDCNGRVLSSPRESELATAPVPLPAYWCDRPALFS